MEPWLSSYFLVFLKHSSVLAYFHDSGNKVSISVILYFFRFWTVPEPPPSPILYDTLFGRIFEEIPIVVIEIK